MGSLVRILRILMPMKYGYFGYRILRILCIADTAVLQIQAKIKYCICIHGYVRIHVPPGIVVGCKRILVA